MPLCATDALLSQMPPAAISFFATFSRFEFALKRSDYARMEASGVVSADWDGFAKLLGKAFFGKVENSGRASALINRPPKKQVLRSGKLDWDPVSKPTNAQELFGAIRRVRNNLFHGAKFSTGVEGDAVRDQQLLEEASWVLHAALAEADQVREQFEQPLP